MVDRSALIKLVRPTASMISGLPVEARIVLLEALLAQEMCNLPPSARDDAMREHLRQFPGVLDATESGMRWALAENARDEP